MSSSARGLVTIGAVAAAALVVAGVVAWFTAPGGSASFGWFAYAPLSDGTSVLPYVLHGQKLLASGLVCAGLIIAGVALGFHWGRRVGRTDTEEATVPHPGEK